MYFHCGRNKCVLTPPSGFRGGTVVIIRRRVLRIIKYRCKCFRRTPAPSPLSHAHYSVANSFVQNHVPRHSRTTRSYFGCPCTVESNVCPPVDACFWLENRYSVKCRSPRKWHAYVSRADICTKMWWQISCFKKKICLLYETKNWLILFNKYKKLKNIFLQ